MTRTTASPPISPELVELQGRDAAIMLVHGSPPELPALLAQAFQATMEQIAASGAQVAGPPFARYLGFGERIDAEVGFPFLGSLITTDRVRQAQLPAGRAVLLTHVGPYEDIATAWAQVDAWIQERGLQKASAPWESYLTGPEDPGPPVTQIVFPVR